jgi:regulatory protein
VADSVVQRRAGKLGAARIQGELQARGLDPELVQSTVAAVRETEPARAREVWLKKFGLPPANAAERARQMRFLAARGFSPELLRRVIEGDEDGA